MKPFFITTAIDYTNGAPHIGHAYEKVLADALARYHRLKGDEVFYLTGVDQHGQKVQQSAEKAGVAPQEFVDGITAKFRALWTDLDVAYDGWAATTDPSHKACVQTLLQRLHAEGQLYKAKQAGYYSVRQEQFLTEKERGPDGEFGPEWGEVVLVEEENYYFKLAEHKSWLLDLLEKRPELVIPGFRLAELRNAVQKLEGDLCISRPKSRLTWGIELPFDPDYVTYVWFDALVNYISFAPGYDPTSKIQTSNFSALWPALHVIGKDIMIPAHGVYWPIMLHAIGFADADMPTLLVHGWWNRGGAKMSKSIGNVVDPLPLIEKYGAAAVRYYLLRDIPLGQDADFNEERLISRYNVDLANGLGNLLNRSSNMTHRYREGRLQPILTPDADVAELRAANTDDATQYGAQFDACKTHLALEHAAAIVVRANAFVDASAPWKLAKDPAATTRLDQVLTTLAEAVQLAATLLLPFVPEKAQAALDQLDLPPASLRTPRYLDEPHILGAPVPIFPRIEATLEPS